MLGGGPLDTFRYRHIMFTMARAATTSDVFNAVAEPQRREILRLLSGGEQSVNQVTEALGVHQPQASKHLRVLKEVGLVDVRRDGRFRLYRLNARGLKPIHDWVGEFERFWNESFDRLDEYLRELQAQQEEESDERNDE